MRKVLLGMLMLLLGGVLLACQPTAEPEVPVVSTTAVVEEDHADEDHSDEDHADEDHADEEHEHEGEGEALTLPELSEIILDGRPLQVVVTSSLIGDIVATVGGDNIELTALAGTGQDPHSYIATPRDLVALASADVIFVNGWDLEEGLARDVETIAADNDIPVVPISANIMPLEFGEDGHAHDEDEEHADEEHADEEHAHSGADPHVWFAVHNVEQWAENTAVVLATLDPASAELYEANAEAYIEQIEALEAELDALIEQIPADRRKIVTNHDAFGYFAHEYDFEVVGTVIPSVSTLAEPSAQDLAGLIEAMREENICVIMTETTVSDQLANTVVAELNDCDSVEVVQLFTGALGGPGSGAENYLDFMRTNVSRIVAALGG